MEKKIQKFLCKFLLITLLLGFSLFFLTSCAPIDSSEIINNLFPNLWVFVSHIVATIILIIIMAWLVWKPTKDSISKRHDYIEGQIKEAEESRNEALKKLAEAQKEKVAAINQAQQIIDDANVQAYEIKEKLEAEGKKNAQIISENALIDAENLKKEISKNMHDEIVSIALDATEKLLQKKISKKDNDKFVDEILTIINNEKGDKYE